MVKETKEEKMVDPRCNQQKQNDTKFNDRSIGDLRSEHPEPDSEADEEDDNHDDDGNDDIEEEDIDIEGGEDEDEEEGEDEEANKKDEEEDEDEEEEEEVTDSSRWPRAIQTEEVDNEEHRSTRPKRKKQRRSHDESLYHFPQINRKRNSRSSASSASSFSSSASTSPLSSPPPAVTGNGELTMKKRGRPKKVKRGRPPAYIYINPHPKFVWVHVNTAVPVTTPGLYANALYNSLNASIKHRTKQGSDPSLLKPATSTYTRYPNSEYYTERPEPIASRTRRWNQESNLKYTADTKIPVGPNHQATIPEYQSSKSSDNASEQKQNVKPNQNIKKEPSTAESESLSSKERGLGKQKVVQLTDLILEDHEKEETDVDIEETKKREPEDIYEESEDADETEENHVERWAGELCWDSTRLSEDEVASYLNEIKRIITADLAEFDPTKANKILACAHAKFGRWAYSEEKSLWYLSSNFDYDITATLNSLREEIEQPDYKNAQSRRSKVGIVVGSVSSRFMEAIPIDPDRNANEDEFCYYCGKDWGTLVICDGANCGRVFHLECLQTEKNVPEEAWRCPICIGQKFMSLTAFSLDALSDVPQGMRILHHQWEDLSGCKNAKVKSIIEKIQREQMPPSSKFRQGELERNDLRDQIQQQLDYRTVNQAFYQQQHSRQTTETKSYQEIEGDSSLSELSHSDEEIEIQEDEKLK